METIAVWKGPIGSQRDSAAGARRLTTFNSQTADARQALSDFKPINKT